MGWEGDVLYRHHLPPHPLCPPQARECRRLVRSIMSASIAPVEALAARFSPFLFLYSPEEKAALLTLAVSSEGSPSIASFREALNRYESIAAAVDAVCPDTVDFRFFSVNTRPLKDALRARTRLLATALLRHVKAHVLHTCEGVNVKCVPPLPCPPCLPLRHSTLIAAGMRACRASCSSGRRRPRSSSRCTTLCGELDRRFPCCEICAPLYSLSLLFPAIRTLERELPQLERTM